MRPYLNAARIVLITTDLSIVLIYLTHVPYIMMAVHQTPLNYSVAINLPNLQIGVSVCRSTIIFTF